MSDSLINNLIFQLTPDEVDAVGKDLKLREQGFNFFYVVDTFDFVHFFMPYLNKINFTEDRINRLAQEAIAYESFFTERENSSIVLVTEYRNELLLVRDMFFQKIRAASELIQNKEDLATEILALIDSGESSFNVINKNFELFVLSLIFSKRGNNLKEISFLKFLKKKMHVNIIETLDSEFDDLVNTAFSESTNKKFIENVYDKFIDDGFWFLKNFKSDRLDRYLANTYADINAIQRVLQANKVICNSDNFKKTIFYYLSSAPFKSKLIFNIINRNYGDLFSLPELFDNNSTSIHRNIFQVFLYNMLALEYPDATSSALEILELLKQINKDKSNVTVLSSGGSTASVGLNNLLNKYTAIVENHFYRGLLINYKETLNDILANKGKEENEKKIMFDFSEFLEFQDEELPGKGLKYDIAKLNQIVQFEKIEAVKVRFGKDIIRFNFHHLPYLLFLFDDQIQKKYTPLYLFLHEISQIENEEEIHEDRIKTYLNQIGKITGQSSKDQILDFLILTYIDLLSINTGEHKEDNDGIELDLIEALEKQLMLSEKAETIQARKKSNSKRQPKISLVIEIRYMLLWLYRRNKMYSSFLELETKFNETAISDPRILHGLGIGLVSYYFDSESGNNDSSKLNKAIWYLKEALFNYEPFHKTIESQAISQLVIKSITGICNSISNSYLILYTIEKKQLYLEQARQYIIMMKDYVEKSKIPYNELPIPNATEAELELFEAETLMDKKEVFLAKKKLEYAKKRYKKSIEKPTRMDAQFLEKIQSKIKILESQLSSIVN